MKVGATALLASEESLRKARRERLKAVSDEALYDLDSYTAKIIAKRKWRAEALRGIKCGVLVFPTFKFATPFGIPCSLSPDKKRRSRKSGSWTQVTGNATYRPPHKA